MLLYQTVPLTSQRPKKPLHEYQMLALICRRYVRS